MREKETKKTCKNSPIRPVNPSHAYRDRATGRAGASQRRPVKGPTTTNKAEIYILQSNPKPSSLSAAEPPSVRASLSFIPSPVSDDWVGYRRRPTLGAHLFAGEERPPSIPSHALLSPVCVAKPSPHTLTSSYLAV